MLYFTGKKKEEKKSFFFFLDLCLSFTVGEARWLINWSPGSSIIYQKKKKAYYSQIISAKQPIISKVDFSLHKNELSSQMTQRHSRLSDW